MAKEQSLVESIERLIGATAEFGAALARAADKTTAGGREPAEGPPGEGATAAIIRHGVSAVANLVGQVADAGQGARAGASSAEAPAPVGQVRPGATLRVPLSIENPGREPMTDLTPAVLAWSREGKETAAVAAVRFEPESLNIEPRDFEKLTVYLDVAHDTGAGRYRLEIALAEGAQTALDFTIAPDTENPVENPAKE